MAIMLLWVSVWGEKLINFLTLFMRALFSYLKKKWIFLNIVDTTDIMSKNGFDIIWKIIGL